MRRHLAMMMLACLALGIGPAAEAAAILVDDFSVGPFSLESSGEPDSVTVACSGIAPERQVTLYCGNPNPVARAYLTEQAAWCEMPAY